MRISCGDIPDEEYEYAALGGAPVICLEDGVPRTFTTQDISGETGLIQVLTALPQGCHTFSLTAIGLDFQSFTDAYCLPTQSGVSIGKRLLFFFFSCVDNVLFVFSCFCCFDFFF